MSGAATPGGATSDDVVQAGLDPDELIDVMERIDWSAVPGISTAEAAAWTVRCIEAQEKIGGLRQPDEGGDADA